MKENHELWRHLSSDERMQVRMAATGRAMRDWKAVLGLSLGPAIPSAGILLLALMPSGWGIVLSAGLGGLGVWVPYLVWESRLRHFAREELSRKSNGKP